MRHRPLGAQPSRITIFYPVACQVDIPVDKRKVTEEEARNWCKECGDLPYIETSAKDAINVDLAFDMAVDVWSRLEAEMDRQNLAHDTIKIRQGQNL
ncbi:unnamed protein product, partial [Nesidiocoris tenuis]